MSWEFTEKDFASCRCYISPEGAAADVANQKLKEWIEASPSIRSYGEMNEWYANGSVGREMSTHMARVIMIEPIVKADDKDKVLAEAAAYLERSYPLMPHPDDEKYRADIAYRIRKLVGNK